MNKLVTDGYIKVKKDGKTYWPISLGQLTALDDDDIVLRYNAVKRGLFNYYMPADNRSQVLGYVDMLLRFSLAKTLAHKHRTTMRAQFQKRGRSLRVTKEVNGINREYNFWECSLAKPKDGGFRHSDRNPLDLIQSWVKVTKSSLLHDECAICGSDDRLQMHHLRHLRKGNKDITKGFNRLLSAVNRKQMCVCHGCHWKIHNGDYDGLALKDLHASGKYL